MIRLANINDEEKIVSIYEDAKELFKELGYFQWKGEYPNFLNFRNDLKNNKVLVIEENNDILSTLTLVYEIDKNYLEINGAWLNNEKYVSIHRNATNKKYYHMGYMKKLFKYAEEYVLNSGINNIRIDTHEDNIYMQNMLLSLGYQKCGIIKLLGRDDLENPYRIAFQKILK